MGNKIKIRLNIQVIMIQRTKKTSKKLKNKGGTPLDHGFAASCPCFKEAQD
jgi:hypothetical protein